MIRPGRGGGFSLLELALVLAIIGFLLGGGLTLFSHDLRRRESGDTEARLRALQAALYDYRIAHGRLPCPGDVTVAPAAVDFGVEASTAGDCSGTGAIRANFSEVVTLAGDTSSGSAVVTGLASTSGLAAGLAVTGGGIPAGDTVASVDSGSQVTLAAPATATATGVALTFIDAVAGLVPTKTLHLPDEDAFDGWGRRILYATDARLTASAAFTTIGAADAGARLTVDDASGHAITTRAAYVLLSFGPDGHGSYPRNGGSTRFNGGATNADELTNCHCNSNGTSAAFSGTFVQKAATEDPAADGLDDFDDLVVYGTRNSLRSPTE